MRPAINERILADIEDSERLLSDIMEDVNVLLGSFEAVKPRHEYDNWITKILSKYGILMCNTGNQNDLFVCLFVYFQKMLESQQT